MKLIAALLLLLSGGLALTSSRLNSPTVDEPLHLFAGYTYIRWGDFRANPEHPPLVKVLAALPLTITGVKEPGHSLSWDVIPEAPPAALFTAAAAAEMLYKDNDPEQTFFPSKLVMIGIAMLLGSFVFIWGKLLFGVAGAISALLLYALDPNLLAHAPIVHSDVPFAACAFIATYFLWRTFQEFTFRDAFSAAGFFALACVTKFAYLSIASGWIILGICAICGSRPIASAVGNREAFGSRRAKTGLVISVLGGAAIAAYLAVWSIYQFRYHAIPGGERPLAFEHVWPDSAFLQSISAFAMRYRVVPEAWLYGQLSVLESLNRDSYLLGNTSQAKGSYLYFPVAILVKTPIPTLALLSAACVISLAGFWISARSRGAGSGLFLLLSAQTAKQRQGLVWLAIPALVYFFFAIGSGMNIGVRHLLPIYPFLFVLCGGVASAFWQSRRNAARGALILLALWYVVSTATVFPHYLAYFNEFAGGPRNGHAILLDSNLDWGQDLKRLRDWMRGAGVKQVQYAYFGFSSAIAPRYYGIDAQFLPGSWVHHSDIAPPAGMRPPLLAVSVNQLHGLYFEGGDKELMMSLRKTEPLARAGHSIWLYNMDAAIDELRARVQRSGSAHDHYHLGNLLNHQGRLRDGIEQYRAAVGIDSGFRNARKKLALALTKTGALDEALEQLRAMLREPQPTEGEINYYVGTLLLHQRRYGEAVESLKAATEAEPKSAQARHQLARALWADGKLDEAVQQYRQALLLDWTNAEIHVALSRLLRGQGRVDEALHHYETALKFLKAESHDRISRPTSAEIERSSGPR